MFTGISFVDGGTAGSILALYMNPIPLGPVLGFILLGDPLSHHSSSKNNFSPTKRILMHAMREAMLAEQAI